jgi:DNA-binding IclR family transcriptional regulator
MSNARKPSRDSYYSTPVERALRVLTVCADGRPSVTLGDIARELKLNKTSSFRFANTLVRLGYLQRDTQTRHLRLGLKAFALGQNLVQNFDLIQIIRPLVDEAFDKYQCSMDVALRDGDVLLVVYRKEAHHTLIFHSPTVMRDLHATALGKAVLAHLDRIDLAQFLSKRRLIPRTKASLTTQALLLADLRRTRERGYSLNNEESIAGLIAVGAPLMSSSPGGVIGAISFDFAKVQCSLRSLERDYAKAVVQLAKDISQMMPVGAARTF